MNHKFKEFQLMVEALGEDATELQVERLVSWVISNLPRNMWKTAALNAMGVGDAYYLISERCGECRV